jgi:hypothetical protein
LLLAFVAVCRQDPVVSALQVAEHRVCPPRGGPPR